MYKDIRVMSTAGKQKKIKAYDADSLFVDVTLSETAYNEYNNKQLKKTADEHNTAFDGYIKDGITGYTPQETRIPYTRYETRDKKFRKSSSRLEGYDSYELSPSPQENKEYPKC